VTGEQQSAGGAGELLLEHELEPVLTHLRPGRIARRRVPGGFAARDRAERADDLIGDIRDR
jgi:hypothetical protein